MQKSRIYEIDTAEVRQLVESGEYFQRAREWYDEIYHRPLGERSFFVAITLCAAITIMVSLVVYGSLLPLSVAVPYVMTTDQLAADDVPTVQRLREEPSEDLNLAIVRYLIKNYIITREKYKYDVVDMERRFNRIRANTAEQEFNKYQAEVNPENSASPYNQYGRDAMRDVQIQQVKLDLESTPQQARVYFATQLVRGTQIKTNQWLATIAFRFPPLTVNQLTNQVMQWNAEEKDYTLFTNMAFEVVEYGVQEVGSAR